VTPGCWASILADLKRDEGWRSREYKDTKGIATIGYGFNVEAHRETIARLIKRPYDGVLTDLEGAFLLDYFAREHWEDLTESLPWVEDSPEPVQRVLLNLAYNLGVAGLLKFRETLGLIRTEQYDDAATRLLTLPYAKQVGQRAYRLATLLRSVV
jgi:lysozyme